MQDYSLDNMWYDYPVSGQYKAFYPKKTPIEFKMEKNFCRENSKSKFYVKGKFLRIPKDSENSISPQIIFETNSNTQVLHLDFKLASKENQLSAYYVWSKLFGENLTVDYRELPKFRLKDSFNLSISCSEFLNSGKWKIEMNLWDSLEFPNGLPRNPLDWDLNYYVNMSLNPENVQKVYVIGNWQIDFAGFTSEHCLGLGSNGLIVPQAAEACDVPRKYLCEYQSCYTTDGFPCIFPFKYKGTKHTKCISEDVYMPWCPTKLEGDIIKDWGLCLDDCIFDPPQPSCLQPPPVPPFGFTDEDGVVVQENYNSSWFNILFNEDKKMFMISRDVRKKLYQPLMVYNSKVVNEYNLSFLAWNQSDHFHDVYEIVPENGTASYTCPLGWVFEGSKNITQTAVCQDWAWNVQFNTSVGCVPVFCPEDELPPFPHNSAEGTTNIEEVKISNQTHWNSWGGEVTYTCPEGYVIEDPSRLDEQDDPIPDDEDVRSFTVKCGDNAVWTPVTTFSSKAMPR